MASIMATMGITMTSQVVSAAMSVIHGMMTAKSDDDGRVMMIYHWWSFIDYRRLLILINNRRVLINNRRLWHVNRRGCDDNRSVIVNYRWHVTVVMPDSYAKQHVGVGLAASKS